MIEHDWPNAATAQTTIFRHEGKSGSDQIWHVTEHIDHRNIDRCWAEHHIALLDLPGGVRLLVLARGI